VTNLLEFLKTVSLFEGFGDNELLALSKALSLADYPADHVFIEEGRRGDGLFLVVEGEVQITRKTAADSGFSILRTIGPGEVFGLIALVDGGPRAATCKAKGAATVAWLPQGTFIVLNNSHAQLAYHFQHLVARQLVCDARNLNELLREAIFAGKEDALVDHISFTSME
jgi:CRP-like cAMP-binding protein